MNYINNEKMLNELKVSIERGVATEKLGGMFLLLARKYSERGSFAGYSWRDDMVCEAVLTCLRYMHNFKLHVENPNPFAYFSIVVHRAFLNYIAKQKKHSKIKDICYKNIDFIVYDEGSESEYSFFNVCGIDYQPIRGNNKKKKRKKKEVIENGC